jgi:hypothetical protein
LKEMSKQKKLQSRSSRATRLIRGSGLAPYSGTSVHPHGE